MRNPNENHNKAESRKKKENKKKNKEKKRRAIGVVYTDSITNTTDHNIAITNNGDHGAGMCVV